MKSNGKTFHQHFLNKEYRNYLIQHSAGSGKTNTIAWLAYRLSSLHDENNEVKKPKKEFNIINNKNFVILNKNLLNSIKRNNERKKINKELEKSLSSFTEPKNKRFNEEEFHKLMDKFDSLEKKRKENIEKLQKQKEEEELRLLKDPETNREENLKYNLNPKNYNITERLYIEDIQKRKNRQEILNRIYTPSFQPQIHTDRDIEKEKNRDSLYKSINHSRNGGGVIKIIRRYYTDENTIDDDYYEEKKNNFNIEEDEGNDEEESEEESDIFKNVKKNNDKGRNRLNKLKKEIKQNQTEEVDSSLDENIDNNNNTNEKKNIIEFKLRNMLFKKKRPVERRNKSVGKRKHVGFSLD